jgi:uncharacterized membrane protein YedE/YeeE
MVLANFSEANWVLLWSAFAVALVLGAVANKTNFCTMGAVSDAVNMGDFGRLRAWLLAIAVAVLGVAVLEYAGLISADHSSPPYRSGQLVWAENLLGGIMFGVGMTLASGCSNKNLIRIGGGNCKAVVVVSIVAVVAYFMVRPIPGTDQTLFSLFFYPWTSPLAVNVGEAQDLGTLLAGSAGAGAARLWIGLAIAAALFWFIFKSGDFRSNADNIVGGLMVGLVVVAAWYVSSNVFVAADGGKYSLSGYASEWDFLANAASGARPANTAALNPQSFTFINPLGDSFRLVLGGFSSIYLTFGVMAVLGIIAGSFLWSAVSGRLRFEWFVDIRDFLNHVIGAVLMGSGGVLAMGCSVGQGVTGISTLACGSFIALLAIMFGSAMTMKMQYYKMVYESDASLLAAAITSLVDLHLLPRTMRRLDA